MTYLCHHYHRRVWVRDVLLFAPPLLPICTIIKVSERLKKFTASLLQIDSLELSYVSTQCQIHHPVYCACWLLAVPTAARYRASMFCAQVIFQLILLFFRVLFYVFVILGTHPILKAEKFNFPKEQTTRLHKPLSTFWRTCRKSVVGMCKQEI